MSLDMWFQRDIRNTLIALHRAQSARVIHPVWRGANGNDVVETQIMREHNAYRDGFNAALQAVALAFGIALDAHVGSHPLLPQPKHDMAEGECDELSAHATILPDMTDLRTRPVIIG